MPLPRLSSRPPGPGQYTAPGAYNRRVTLNFPANPTAGVLENPYTESWAAMRAIAGQELDKAQQLAQKSTHLITIPYQTGVTENMTVSLNEGDVTRKFQIEYIEDPDERHIELRMMCFEMNQNAGGASAARP
jgi:SPP1 family predicted phage head-tail adaptor